jgi:hypothetical protein
MAKASKAKAQPKPKGTPAKASKPERRDNRYLRASRIIVSVGETEGMDPIQLAMKAKMSKSTAGHCIDAFPRCLRRPPRGKAVAAAARRQGASNA